MFSVGKSSDSSVEISVCRNLSSVYPVFANTVYIVLLFRVVRLCREDDAQCQVLFHLKTFFLE